MLKFILVLGQPLRTEDGNGGYTFVGPFDTGADAVAYAGDPDKINPKATWQVAELDWPDED